MKNKCFNEPGQECKAANVALHLFDPRTVFDPMKYMIGLLNLSVIDRWEDTYGGFSYVIESSFPCIQDSTGHIYGTRNNL